MATPEKHDVPEDNYEEFDRLEDYQEVEGADPNALDDTEILTATPFKETTDPSQKIGKLAELLDASGIQISDVEKITKVQVGTYQMIARDRDGEIRPHTLEVARVELKPKTTEDTDYEKHFITQAAPTKIYPSRRIKPVRRDQLAVAMGDAQIGYRGEEPFHSEYAMRMGHAAVRELQPDKIVLTGDMLDLPAQSLKFEQRADWQDLQRSIDRYHNFLSQLRADAPNARIIDVRGNHEARLAKSIRAFNGNLLGLRRANAEQELGVLTIAYLCKYDELEIEAIEGYPNGRFWLEDNLQVMHGTQTRQNGGSANTYLNHEDVSTIYGHDHRLAVVHKTVPGRDGEGRDKVAASPGCLARTDGAVPGRNYTTDDHNQTVKRAENWQNGLLIINHNERFHDINKVHIHREGMRLSPDKFYEAEAV